MTENPETNGSQPRPARLDGLDGLRGIAAIMVAIMHMFHVNQDGQGLERAYLAVDLFFVLSGYVMARTYEARMRAGLRPLDFTVLRLRRLWPTMAVGALIGMATFWARNDPAASLRTLALALFFIPKFDPVNPTFPTNPPAWSILFEILVNVLHALVLHRLGLRSLAVIALASAAVLACFAPNMNIGGSVGNLWMGVARVLYSYCAGIMIWRWRGERPLLPGWFGIAALPLAILGISNAPFYTPWLDFTFVFVLCPLIVLAGLAPLPFARRLLRELGAISFPLYAIHFPLTMALLFNGYGTLVALPVALVAAWLTAWLLDGRWRRSVRPGALPA